MLQGLSKKIEIDLLLTDLAFQFGNAPLGRFDRRLHSGRRAGASRHFARTTRTAQRTRALARTSASADVIAYVPPEVLQAQAVDARSDLYSLAVVLYQCLAGRLPADVTEPLSSIDPAVPQDFSDLISETLSSDAALRPASADAFRHRLSLVPAVAQ